MNRSPRLVEVRKNVLKKNDEIARALRTRFSDAGVLVVSLPINFWRLARDLDVHWTHLLWQLRGWGLRFTIAAAICAAIGRLAPPPSLWPLVGASALAVVVYGIAMLPLALEAPLGRYVRAAWTPVVGLFGGKWPLARGSRP